MSVNKVILIGRLTADPESKSFPSGGSVCNLRVATNRSWRDKDTGERKEAAEYHSVVLRNKLGEIAQQYLRKGSQVYIEGRIQTRKWQDKNGQDRYSTEIVGNEMTMLGGRDGGNSSGGTYQSTAGGGASVQWSEYSPTGAGSEPPRDGYYGDDIDVPF